LDTFGSIGKVGIFPIGTTAYKFDALVTSKGQIIQPTLIGTQSLGQIFPDGSYQLVNGLQGNVFRDPYVQFEKDMMAEQNPFAQTMKAEGRKVAIANSEIPLLRKRITGQGLTGEGLKIGILDSIPITNGRMQPSNHSKLVASIIQDPIWGVAPKANVIHIGPPYIYQPQIVRDDPQAWLNMIVEKQCKEFNTTSQQLKTITAFKDPALRVLSLSQGRARATFYRELWSSLRVRNEQDQYQFPYTRAMILGPALYGTEQQQRQAVVRFVDQVFENSPVLKQSQQRYIEATQKAAQNGINLVVAMANEHGEFPCLFPLAPGAEMNELAKSPYVISVAASNTNGTPGFRQDDRLANFSSHGDGALWNPTLAAPGHRLGVSFPFGEQAPNYVANGTSVAAPYVAGVISLMLQKNPTLTFEQIKNKLQYNAVKSPEYSTAEVGAGFLNPEAAILTR